MEHICCYVNIISEDNGIEIKYRFFSTNRGEDAIMVPLFQRLSGLTADEIAEFLTWLGFIPTTLWDHESPEYTLYPDLQSGCIIVPGLYGYGRFNLFPDAEHIPTDLEPFKDGGENKITPRFGEWRM